MAANTTSVQKLADSIVESEEHFRVIADAAPAMIWTCDTAHFCTFVNRSWLEFTGRPLEAELGNGWVDGIHPDDLATCLRTCTAAFEQRQPFRMEYRIRRADGEYRWILDQGAPRFNSDGSFAGYIGSCIDITDRKRAEESRLRQAVIIESSEDAIISKDLDAIIVGWNEAAERIFGYTEAQAVGQPITILIPPELHDEENEILERLRSGGRIEHHETIRITKTGRKVDVSLMIGAIKDSTGRTVGFSKIVRDITERKQSESALRAREELLKIFVKHVPAGVAMFDREMRYLQVSDRWCADYNLNSSEVIGRSHYEIFPDVPDRWKEMHRRGLAGETLRADEEPWDRHDGTWWVRWEIRPWRSRPDGPPEGILIFAEETTRRKQMEEELSRVSQKLIEAHEEERTRIARELHDDINQRLAVLAVALEGLEENARSSSPGLQREIGNIVKQLQDLGNDVQAISHRLHSSKLEYLGLASATAGFCREISQRGVQINFHADNVPKDLPKEISLCLFRLLQEGVQNAIKHSGARQFQVSLTGTSSQIELIVRDSGRGFDPEEALKGDGLGLTSMIERLKLVNGTLSIDSQPEHGTTVQARVPLTLRAKSAQLGVL